jgi:hypothetical protein
MMHIHKTVGATRRPSRDRRERPIATNPGLMGSNSGWIKVKTRTWREANRERYKLFEKA